MTYDHTPVYNYCKRKPNAVGCCLLQEGPKCILLIPCDRPGRSRVLSHYKETHGLQHYEGESEEGAIPVTCGAQGNMIITAVTRTQTGS